MELSGGGVRGRAGSWGGKGLWGGDPAIPTLAKHRNWSPPPRGPDPDHLLPEPGHLVRPKVVVWPQLVWLN